MKNMPDDSATVLFVRNYLLRNKLLAIPQEYILCSVRLQNPLQVMNFSNLQAKHESNIQLCIKVA